MEVLKRKRVITVTKYWFLFQLFLAATVFIIFSLNCFVKMPVLLLHFATLFQFFYLNFAPIIVALIFFAVCFGFKEDEMLKNFLMKGIGIILLLCIIERTYRKFIPEDIGILNDYRYIFVLLFLPITCIAIIVFEIKLNKHIDKK